MGFFRKIFGSRHFNGAVNAHLADYTHDSISVPDRERVFDQQVKIVERLGITYSHFMAHAPPPLPSVLEGLAMQSLGIKPAVSGSTWLEIGDFLSLRITDREYEKAHDFIRVQFGIDVHDELYGDTPDAEDAE